MLDKITKINTSSNFSKSTGENIYRAGIKSKYNPAFDRHDSVDMSPAFKYLIKVNWRIKELKYNSDVRLFVVFIVSGIEFQLTLDLLNFNNLSFFNYRLLKEGANGDRKYKVAVNLTSKIESIDYNQNTDIINLTSINIFFNRIFEQNIINKLSDEDKYIFDNLISGIIQGIRNEFTELNNQVLIFLDRLIDKKITTNLSTTNDNVESVLIKKIKIIDV